jgi:hypothetical protein
MVPMHVVVAAAIQSAAPGRRRWGRGRGTASRPRRYSHLGSLDLFLGRDRRDRVAMGKNRRKSFGDLLVLYTPLFSGINPRRRLKR